MHAVQRLSPVMHDTAGLISHHRRYCKTHGAFAAPACFNTPSSTFPAIPTSVGIEALPFKLKSKQTAGYPPAWLR